MLLYFFIKKCLIMYSSPFKWRLTRTASNSIYPPLDINIILFPSKWNLLLCKKESSSVQ